MKVLLSSLNKFLDLSGMDPKKIAADLTMGGLKVDAVEYLGKGLERVVVGKIEKIEKHPNAEKLTVCSVNTGNGPVQIVCGAKNMAEGDHVPVALPGAELPCGVSIKESQLRGVASCGMMCSEKELGLSQESSGLLILPKDVAAGTPFARYRGVDDWLFDIDVTAQRGDAMSALGVARDLAAVYDKKIGMPEFKLAQDASAKTSGKIKITIGEPELCPRYAGRYVENVKVAPSPAWLAGTLEKLGMRPVNNVVDVTNYVSYMFGHPSHAFDFSKLASGEITVRRARSGEKMAAIDNREYELGDRMLAICDNSGPQAIAGVMGGLGSEVGATTSSLLIEVAVFDPVSVRMTSKKLNLASDSSQRFSRGVDVSDTEYVSNAIAALIAELSPGARVFDGIVDAWPGKARAARPAVKINTGDLSRFAGQDFASREVAGVLARLGFTVTEAAGGNIEIGVPTYRHDIALPCDIYEEFLRIYGYNRVAETEILFPYSAPIESSYQAVERVVSSLAGSGFYQCMNYSFLGKGDIEKTGFAEIPQDRYVCVRNPLGSEFSVMRPTMLFGLLANLRANLNSGAENVRIFETGKVYYQAAGTEKDPAGSAKAHVPCVEGPDGCRRIVEKLMVAGLMFGKAAQAQWNSPKADVDFFAAKGVLENLLDIFRVKTDFAADESRSHMHPKKTAAIKLKSGEAIGYAGVIHPGVAKAFDIDYSKEVIYFELCLDALLPHFAKPFRVRQVSKFPQSVYDLAIMVRKEIPYSEIEKVCLKSGGKYLKSVAPFDEYTGEKMPEGRKSVAFTLTFQSDEGTLADAETKKSFEDVIRALGEKLGGELRS